MTSASCRRPRSTWPGPALDPSRIGCGMRCAAAVRSTVAIPFARPRASATAPLWIPTSWMASSWLPLCIRPIWCVSAWPATSRSSCWPTRMASRWRGPRSTTTVSLPAMPRIRPRSRTMSPSMTTRPCSTTWSTRRRQEPIWCGCRGYRWLPPCWGRAFPSPTPA